MQVRLVAASMLLLCATAAAEEPAPTTTSYRAQTLAADAVGLSLLIGGSLAEEDGGRDTQLSDTLFTAGGLTMMFATPAIHLLRGHRQRAASSLVTRVGLSAGGFLVAMYANANCGDGEPPPDGALFDDDSLCELDYVGYGVFGGLVVASVVDAAFRTDEPARPHPRWSPQLSATRDGVRAAVAWAW